MKLLVMCEGPNEKAVVDMLLEAGCLSLPSLTLLKSLIGRLISFQDICCP